MIGNNAHNMQTDQIFRSVLAIDYTLNNGIDIRSISGFQHARGALKIDLDGTNGTGLTNGETFADKAGRIEDFDLGHQSNIGLGYVSRDFGATENSLPFSAA